MRGFAGILVFFVAVAGPATESSDPAPTATAQLGELTLRARIHGPAQGPDVPIKGVATWHGKDKRERVNFELAAGAPGSVTLPAGTWLLEASLAGLWSTQESVVITAGATASLTFHFWPQGSIAGGFLDLPGSQPPSTLVAFFRATPSTSAKEVPPPGKVWCTVEKLAFRCDMPAGTVDLRFQADGYVPRYVWDVAVLPGKTTALGRFDLKAGSAVLGWAVTGDGQPLGEGGRVELRPRIAGAISNTAERERLASLTFAAPITAKGFFQIDGVPPGAYILEARHERYAAALTSVRVVAGEVTEVANPPLTFEPPKTLEVLISPSTDPLGGPWHVKLQRLDRDSFVATEVGEGKADLAGVWRKTDISAGSYTLTVSRARGDKWWSEVVEVDELLTPIQVVLEIVHVKGTVSLGGKPLAASLTFGGRFGAVRLSTESDEDGSLEIDLPRSGEWRLRVTAQAEDVERELRKVKIEPKPGSSVAELDIELPNSRLSGRVVDESGKAMGDVIVTVQSIGERREPLVQLFTDAKGHFKLAGLLPGPALIEADAGEDLIANALLVTIPEDSPLDSLRLVVRRQLRLRGSIGSAAGPVAGARIKARPVGVEIIGARSVASNAKGELEVIVPPETKEVFLSVGPPGFAFRMLRVPVIEDRSFAIGVDQLSGSLIVEQPVEVDPLDPASPFVVVLHAGSLEGLGYLGNWALSAGVDNNERRKLIPAMEPGDYTACLVMPSEAGGLAQGAVPNQRCVSGTLAANGELRLRVPGP